MSGTQAGRVKFPWKEKGCGISPLKDGMRKKQMGGEMAPSYSGTKDESDFPCLGRCN